MEQSELQPVSVEQMAELKALESVDIDCSDIPELSAGSFENAVRGKFYKPLKAHVTVRIDADIIAWLKAPGKGYQTRLNSILRERMLHH
jgi:uncharacterized protein (DUF4415 family)